VTTQKTLQTPDNFLFILVDELHYACMSAVGHPVVNTPSLDRLRSESVEFTHCFTTFPLCCPSRASMNTGTYPEEWGVLSNRSKLPDHAVTWGHRLAEAGFDVPVFGKTHGQNPGFRHVPPPGPEAFGQPPGGPSFSLRMEPVTGVFEGRTDDFYDFAVCSQFEEYLASRDRCDRFAAYVGIHSPHCPLYPPREYLDGIDRSAVRLPDVSSEELAQLPDHMRHVGHVLWGSRDEQTRRDILTAYYALVHVVDDAVGRLLDSLQRHGLRDNTLVVFTSDHGDSLGQHGMLAKRWELYDSTVRLPLFVSFPAVFEPGIRDTLVSSVDFFPTWCDVLGVDAPSDIHGKSFAPAVLDAAVKHRDHVYARCTHGMMVRTRQWKYAHFPDYGPQLFDLETDPDETRNRASERGQAQRMEELQSLLLETVFHTSGSGIHAIPNDAREWE
jgi:choline-sulfatase